MPPQAAMPAIAVVKLRMKVGVHEFEAEGPRELVLAQIESWKQLAGLGAASAAGDVRTADAGDAALQQLFTVDAPESRG
jgi:hypothetical protein